MIDLMSNDMKVAMVTGGATGIGRATIERLARDGFAVAINYLESEAAAKELVQLLEQQSCVASAFRADITQEDEVKRLFEDIFTRFGRLDVVVSNAGINQTASVEEIDMAAFDAVLDVNLRGAVHIAKYAVPLLRQSGTGRMVFISSTNPFMGSPKRVAYTASKAALLGLSRSLALELAPDILVNAVVPGYIDTQMFRKFSSEPEGERVKKILLGRIGRPEEVANVVSFLCSEDSSYVTGQHLHVNGGVFFPE
ncbi:MAG: SDR family NAD(P)-dependent oxidoreductase [Undibacterium sp.]